MKRLTHEETIKALSHTRRAAYHQGWDLSTIPANVWASEQGKRSRAKAPRATNVKLEPCKHCGEPLNARERRRSCKHCGRSQRKVI